MSPETPLLDAAAVAHPPRPAPVRSAAATPVISSRGRTNSIKRKPLKIFKHPYYEPIKSNEYVAPKKIHRDQIQLCNCEKIIGVLGCKNRKCNNFRDQRECPANCALGELCANKRFNKLKQPRCLRFRTDERGYGVKASERIPKNTLIREYVGEVIDNDEKRRRHEEYLKAGYPPDYFMIVDDNRIIDATIKGNIARFVNHSCEPNCELQSWTVDGVKRIGIFSIKTIMPGEEISFNYGPSYHHIECHCGATTCTGWINGFVSSYQSRSS